MHAKVGQNHLEFAQKINDIHDAISTTFKNTERSRKQVILKWINKLIINKKKKNKYVNF